MEHTAEILHLCGEGAGAAGSPAVVPISETADPAPLAPFDTIALAARHDGWTPERQRAFIEELADCGIVSEAAARVGMSERSARRLRRRPGAASFNRAWDDAVRIGSERLHSLAWERAVNGTIRHRYFRGQVVGEERVFDNRLLIYLLGRTSPHRSPAEVATQIVGWDDRMDAVEGGLPEPQPAPGENYRSPVWFEKEHGWLTHFPPPPGFDGQEQGEWGDDDYCRTLAPDEEAKLHAWLARSRAEGRRQRDRYFDRLG